MQGSNWLLYITSGIFLGPEGVFGIFAPIRYVHDGFHLHSSKFGLVSFGAHHRHTLAHTIVHKSNDTTSATPGGFIFSGWGYKIASRDSVLRLKCIYSYF